MGVSRMSCGATHREMGEWGGALSEMPTTLRCSMSVGWVS